MAVVRVLHSRVLYGKRSCLQKRVCVGRFGMGVREKRGTEELGTWPRPRKGGRITLQGNSYGHTTLHRLAVKSQPSPISEGEKWGFENAEQSAG